MAMATALIGVLLYVVSMQDVEARRFTSYNSVYLLNFGYAAYCAIAGAILCIINFVLSIPMVVLTYAWNRAKHTGGGIARGHSGPIAHIPGPDNQDNPGVFVVERDPESRSIVSVKKFYDDQDVQSALKGGNNAPRTPSLHDTRAGEYKPSPIIKPATDSYQQAYEFSRTGKQLQSMTTEHLEFQSNAACLPLSQSTFAQSQQAVIQQNTKPVYIANYAPAHTTPSTPQTMTGYVSNDPNMPIRRERLPSWTSNVSRTESRV
jgi:hypothetical protein